MVSKLSSGIYSGATSPDFHNYNDIRHYRERWGASGAISTIGRELFWPAQATTRAPLGMMKPRLRNSRDQRAVAVTGSTPRPTVEHGLCILIGVPKLDAASFDDEGPTPLGAVLLAAQARGGMLRPADGNQIVL